MIRWARVPATLFGVGALLAMGSAAAFRSTMLVFLLLDYDVSGVLVML